MLAKKFDWVKLEDFDGYSDNVFLGPEAESFYAGLVVLKQGISSPKHVHKEGEQIFIVLEGKGVVSVGEEEEEVQGGMFVYIPCNKEHYLKNTGDNSLKYIYICNWHYTPGAERSSDGLSPRPRRFS